MTTGRVTTLSDPDTVADILTPARREILGALTEPDTATGIAARVASTRQKVNYHLRALEEAGLVELVEERPRRGLTERVMRRTSDVVLVAPTTFDSSGLTRGDVVGLSGVVATASELISQAASISATASDGGRRVAAAVLDTEIRVESPAAMRSLLDEIATVIARFDSDSGLAVRIATTALPAVRTP